MGTQTDTHILEYNIVKSYEWNEWELRRKALKMVFTSHDFHLCLIYSFVQMILLNYIKKHDHESCYRFTSFRTFNDVKWEREMI